MNIFRLVLSHMRFHWRRTALLVGCATVCFLLPMLIPQMVQRIQVQLYQRSESIPLVIGSQACSPLDLTLHALYYRGTDIPTIRYGWWQDLSQRHPVGVLPIHARFVTRYQDQEYPIVGTHLEYFEQRELRIHEGQFFATLGDCVVGASIAREMGLQPGSHVISHSESVVSLASAYPVQLNVVGVLEPTQSVEDDVVLVDIKTAWVIENLGHGHQDVSVSNDPNLVLERTDQGTVASPAVVPYTVITEDNLGSFHFHGDSSDFPITAVLVTSQDQRTRDLLSGKAQRAPELQAVVSKQQVGRLLAVVFQVQWLLLAVVLVVGLATAMLFSLVMALSIQIRGDEMRTMFKLGASRGFTFQLHMMEILLMLSLSLLVAILATVAILHYLNDQWVQWLI